MLRATFFRKNTKFFFAILVFLLINIHTTDIKAFGFADVDEALQQQTRRLSGKVYDKNGESIPGASVMLKGTTTGTATDANGNFSLSIPVSDKAQELVITFIGMETTYYKVGKSNEIKIIMVESAQALQEVVVTGMEVIKKDRMTGSASVVTSKDLKMQGITSVDRILDGLVAGLNSTTVSGAPGTRSKITIRGENNLSGNTEPLWILDGLPMLSGVPKSTTGDYAGTILQDGVGNVMPEDIESISILKDASAAAIYGARAANGVIVITTKKGFRSKTQINYSGTYEVGVAPQNNLDFMSGAEKIKYERSIIDNFGFGYTNQTGRGGFLYNRFLNGYLTKAEYENEINKISGYNTNWFDVIFRTAQSHSHNISLRGGTEEMTYYTSINYQKKDGILLSNRYENVGALMKLDYRPIKKLIIAMNVQANTRKNIDHASRIDPFTYAMFANRYERPYDDNGNYAPDLSYLSGNYTSRTGSGYIYDKFNIIKELQNTKNTQKGIDAQVTFNLRYEILPRLAIESIYRNSVSYNTGMTEIDAGTYSSWRNENFARAAFPDAPIMPSIYDNGQLSESSGINYNWSLRNQADYSFNIKEKHLFSILVANEVMSRKFNNFGYTSPIYNSDYRITGVPTFNSNVPYEHLRGSISGMFNTRDGQDRSVSFLSSMRYGYADKYIVNFNFRADGADVIGNTNRFTPLWSLGLRYNLHHEKFFPKSLINELSLRASYGYTGNIDRSAYPFSTISLGNQLYMGNRYARGFTYPNPTVGWEKKRDQNFGIDMSFFNRRISFTADYYQNRITDILEYLPVPFSTGRENVKANGGIVENKGLELYLNVKWIDKKDLTFSTSGNVAFNKNVIVKSHYGYDSYADAIKSNPVQGGSININGAETGGVYGWVSAGVNPKTGNPRYYLTEEGKRSYSKFLDGWDSYTDQQKKKYAKTIEDLHSIPDVVDYVRNEDDIMPYYMASMQYLGSSNPKLVGGFNTQLRYKSFEFSTSWSFKTGHIIPNFNDYQNAPNNTYLSSAGYSSDLGVSATNRERKYLNYWQYEGDVTDIPAFVTSGSDYWASVITSDKYSKGDYLRLTNISLSYRLPSEIAKKMKMNNILFGVNARNLLTFTKYNGLDVGTGGAFTYPAYRELNFKLTFGL